MVLCAETGHDSRPQASHGLMGEKNKQMGAVLLIRQIRWTGVLNTHTGKTNTGVIKERVSRRCDSEEQLSKERGKINKAEKGMLEGGCDLGYSK